MGYDDILPLTGGFSTHQRKLYLLLFFPTLTNVFFKVGNVLLVAVPKYRCRLPFESEYSSYYLNDTQLSTWYPFNEYSQSYSSCSYLANNITEQKCDYFVFDDQLGRTLSVDFQLTCEKDYLIATSNSLSMFGFMIGSLIFGNASDRWGRKRMFMVAGILYLIVGTSIVFSPNIWVFLTLKILLGIVASGIFYTIYVLLIESTDPSKRVLVGTSLLIFFPLGFIINSLLGYMTPTWKHLQIIYTAFGLPIILYFWFLPESPRWLISKNKIEDAKKIIIGIARENKVVLLNKDLDTMLTNRCKTVEHPKQVSILDAMKYPTLRNRIFIFLLINFANFMGFYGLTWNVGSLSGNLYINFALMGASDLPGFFMVLFTAQTFGRRRVLSTYMISASLCLILLLCKPSDGIWVLVWTLIGKLFLGSATGLCYVYSSEVYPTVLRNVGLGLGAVFGSIGSILASYVFYLNIFWTPLPIITFIVIILFGGCMCLLLPETFGKKLPETLEEGESFGK